MTTFTAPAGGVMTEEVGAITGELDLVDVTSNRAHVRYAGADEAYTVAGLVPKGWSLDTVVAHLTRDPGADDDGNARATDLSDAQN